MRLYKISKQRFITLTLERDRRESTLRNFYDQKNLNHKKGHLAQLEGSFGLAAIHNCDNPTGRNAFLYIKGEISEQKCNGLPLSSVTVN